MGNKNSTMGSKTSATDPPSILREHYKYFRILVIGRANAGKTTLLKRVCNTTEEPCIYDGKNNLLEPTADCGNHDIHHPFAFDSNPQFIFHDSPGFEKGGEKELKDVWEFIEQCAKATEVVNQLHAIWFCVVTDASRPLLELEERFFNERHYGNVPVIAVLTKFDDFVNQVSKPKMKLEEKYKMAIDELQKKFEEPLNRFKFPPKAILHLEDMQEDDGNHQEQVKKLIEKTADSLHDPALKLLFVSIQQNNLELCIKYAIEFTRLSKLRVKDRSVELCLQWFRHAYYGDYNYEKTEDTGELQRRIFLRQRFEGQHLLMLHVEKTMNIIKQDSLFYDPLELYAALLICAESSFWFMSGCQVGSFENGFQKAWDMLTADKKRQEGLQTALRQLPDDRNQKDELTMNGWKQTFFQIILQNRLSNPNRQ